MLGPSWKSYFSVTQFSLKHDRPVAFIVSQWQHDKTTPNFRYLIIRLSILIFFFVSWVFTFIGGDEFPRSAKWPIFLTNWGFTLCTLQALVAAGMLSVAVLAERLPSKSHWREKALTLYPFYWVLNGIATSVAFTVTIMYWAIIYNAEHARFDAMNFLVHAANSILMFVDLWLVSHPIRILHFLYPLLLSLAYTIFTIIYFVSGGLSRDGTPYIYPILKWDNPGSTTLVCLGVMAFLLFLHLCTYFVYLLRLKIYEILFLPKMEPPKSSPKGYVNEGMANDTV
ncbi:protein rolling stone-like [Cylas formicarius]|uniref:protein rolling stone-like n=1 Tax=Cylas formicarius TaxID=197179 RepID=UPI0029589009|nr:protein rolling stone-like [Cylas formicarius]XP_060516255.1 protein rolling stone-like [Cylas formicarius]XP_060516256.1 protein rolling stone-like [Cylas formicarius]XP_060516257.1 protein rolling stone-like [Cylas formicarius]XP_060516258.1 protein rolling stone-like [Cylas formicarius]XP_060516259.1 protein rolling stone-like [Cylas formicarius]XP_060516260.1 protein rolling stone-like [Cylas formicarius]XP_060516261.1 protein rolling stone-like [Cylas formicarius]XP_060516262.1 prot